MEPENSNPNPTTEPPVSPVVDQPIPPASHPTPPKKKFPLIIVIAIVIFLLTISGVAGFYVYKNNTAKPREVACTAEAKICSDGSSVGRTGPSCEFAPCPTTSADPTADWKTYSDLDREFKFQYPSTYVLRELREGIPLLNHKIYWSISPNSYKDCQGPCPVIDSTKEVTISDQKATKIKGYIGGIGGNIPQSYIKYEIQMPSSKYLSFTLWELPQDSDWRQYRPDRDHQEISKEDEKTFDKILSTFKFTNSRDSQIIPTLDETQNWLDFSKNKISFKYPQGYEVIENVPDSFVVREGKQVSAPLEGIGIDARSNTPVTSLDSYVAQKTLNLTNIVKTSVVNGIIFQGTVGPGFGEGQKVRNAYLLFGNKIITASMLESDPSFTFDKFKALISTIQYN